MGEGDRSRTAAMASSTSTLFLLLLIIVFIFSGSGATAFNITDILSQHPEFSNFNSYLTLTGDADEINRRQTITVLAVNNAAMSAVMGQPLDVIRNVLGVHVVLDYYDLQKLQSLGNGTAILVTMFQASGLASGQMGFLNATVFPWGVALGSAVPGAGINSNLVQSVFGEPYNISVMQVSSLIVPPGIAGTVQPLPPPPPPPPASAPFPAAAPPKSAAAPTKTPPAAPSPSAPVPAQPPKKAPSAAPTPAATPSAPAPQPKESRKAAPPITAPEPTPSNPPSPPSPFAFPPSTAPDSESPVEPPAAAGAPSSGMRVVVGEGLAIAAAAVMGAALLVGF